MRSHKKGKIKFDGIQFYGQDGKPSVFVEAHPDVKKEIEAELNKETPSVFEEVIRRINEGDATVFNEGKHWTIWNAYRAGKLKDAHPSLVRQLELELDLCRSTLE